METDKRPFIKKPHFFKPETKFKINESKIHYTDLLTYTALRSFLNSSTRDCYPSLETIAKRAGVCKSFVIDSIYRLESAEYISVWRSREIKVVNKYYFKDPVNFDRIPYEFFFYEDLTLNEKSILLALRELTDINLFHIEGSIKDIAATLCMSYKMLHKQLTSLIAKGYVRQLGKAKYSLEKVRWLFMDGKPREPVKKEQERFMFFLS